MKQRRKSVNFIAVGLIALLPLFIGLGINNIFHRTVTDSKYKSGGPADPIQAVVEWDRLVDKSDMPKYRINLDEKWQKLIYELCEKNDLDYEITLSFFYHESEGFKLELVCYNRDRKGKVLSFDSGIAQINNKYTEEYRQHAVKYCELDKDVKFDPLNPDHGIRAGIGGLAYYRDYWKSKGITEEDTLFYYSVNSYNMGADTYVKYVANAGAVSRSYDREILKWKEQLEKEWELK